MTTVHPLLRLVALRGPHRGRIVRATTLSVANKLFDVVPEILIGVAVDVVVRGNDSCVADVTGIESRASQLVALAALNAVVWLLRVASPSGATSSSGATWRRPWSTTCGWTPTRTCRSSSSPTSRTRRPAG